MRTGRRKGPLLNMYVVSPWKSHIFNVFNVRLYLFWCLSSVYERAETSIIFMRCCKLLAICAIFASFSDTYFSLFFLLRDGRKSAPWTSVERTSFYSIFGGFATVLKGSRQLAIQGFDFVSAMSSQLETVVLHEFFTRAACESVSPKNGEISSHGSLETETIQKFLSICLKQYFSCSEDDTKVRFPSSEILNINIIYLLWFT